MCHTARMDAVSVSGVPDFSANQPIGRAVTWLKGCGLDFVMSWLAVSYFDLSDYPFGIIVRISGLFKFTFAAGFFSSYFLPRRCRSGTLSGNAVEVGCGKAGA